ncbi:MAG: CHAT domain-containing protein [Acidobacteriia bacterium]|nr:CHAT domain-containing protein [Terriglobia bacterium]
MTPAPRIEQRWTCIAAADQTALSAQLSSYFSEAGTYFAVFEFPDIDRPYEEVATRDGYFAQLMGKRAATHINNCLAHIQPEKIILLGLSGIAETYVRAILPAQKLVAVNNEAELLALPFVTGVSEPLRCKASQAIQGLIAAKNAKRPLTFSEDAPDLPSQQLNGKKGLVLIENSADVGEVSIANYAASIDADVVLVEPVEREQLQSLAQRLQAWATDRSSPALGEVKKKVTSRIKGLDFSGYGFATFFTAGLPYGLILKNVVPFTHVLNGPYCGVFITNAIVEEAAPTPVGSAIVFSPKHFASDEVKDVGRQLDQNNFIVTELVGPEATNDNLHDYGSHFPYDLLHICSHGGETDGYFVKQEFKDRNGDAHTIEYFEIVSWSLEHTTSPDKVLVTRKMIYTTFDGIPWIERPLKLHPRYVGDDMLQALREEDETLKRTPVNVPIALSCHIACHESFHQGNFEHLAAYSHPIIFNNSCSSSHELAAGFLSAGARCYLATLWNVGNETATKAALAFYGSALSDGKVLPAFSEMLRSITTDPYRNIYILWGLHFTSLVRPPAKSDDNIIAGLAANYSIWIKKLTTARDDEVKRNTIPIVRFLISEIRRRLSPERLAQIFASNGVEEPAEVERSGAVGEEPEPRELIVTKEVDPHKQESGAS